jgi:hypothetical protein
MEIINPGESREDKLLREAEELKETIRQATEAANRLNYPESGTPPEATSPPLEPPVTPPVHSAPAQEAVKKEREALERGETPPSDMPPASVLEPELVQPSEPPEFPPVHPMALPRLAKQPKTPKPSKIKSGDSKFEKLKFWKNAPEADPNFPPVHPMALYGPGGPLRKEDVPKTPEEKKIVAEIKNLPEEDRERLSWGLNRIGYNVEKMKDDFFAKALAGAAKKADKKGTFGRFVNELRETFVRDAKEAEKKGLAIQKGESKGKIVQARNLGLLTGNVLKYGRFVYDTASLFRGLNIANPFRYVMLSGQLAARGAEAGKEARFKNDRLLEKTQIKDAKVAAEEAWRIYENAGGKVGDVVEENGILKYEDGGVTNVSAEALKNAYLKETPRDIQERLKDPTTALNFVQQITRKQIEIRLNRLQKKIDFIGYKWDSNAISKRDGKEGAYTQRLSPEQKEVEKQKLLEGWKKELMDYDRMITQYGTVDQVAMWAKNAQVTAKGIVYGMQAQTLYKSVTNIPKLWEHLSHMLSSHGEALPATTGGAGHLMTENKTPGTSGGLKKFGNDLGHKIFGQPEPAPMNATPEEMARFHHLNLTGEQTVGHHVQTPHTEISPTASAQSSVGHGPVKTPGEEIKTLNLKEPTPPGLPKDYEKISHLPPHNIPEHVESPFEKIAHTPQHAEPIKSPLPDKLTKTKLPPLHGEPLLKTNPDIIVHKGEGIEHTFIRQIQNNPKMAQELGFKGDINDKSALHTFAEKEAHIIALKTGYVEQGGAHQVGVMQADKVGYEIRTDGEGHPVVIEKTIDGKILGTYKEGDLFGKNPGNQYEKEFVTTHALKAPALEGQHKFGYDHFDSEGNPAKPTLGQDYFNSEGEVANPTNSNISPDYTPETPNPVDHIGDLRKHLDDIYAHTQEVSKGTYDNNGNLIQHSDQPTPIQPSAEGHPLKNIFFGEKQHLNAAGTATFEKNYFNLNAPKLAEVYEFHKNNLNYIFRYNQNGANVWKGFKGLRVDKILKGLETENKDENSNPLLAYLHRLQQVTKLKPQNGIIHKETIEEFMTRASQKAATMTGGLKRVAESIGK